MGKLIRNGIEYGGGNGTDIFEVTQAQYDALVQAGTLVHNALYVITDAPNLNATASDIEYSSGVTVKQAIDGKIGLVPNGTYDVCGIWSENYYSARSMWIPFPRADLYTISITRARYVSGTNTMTDITTTTQITNKNALGFQAYTTSNVDNHFGDIQFTVALT